MAGREYETSSHLSTAPNQYEYGNRSQTELMRMLEERDRKVAILEKQLLDYGFSVSNYPPCLPIVFLDISKEVPTRRQGFARGVLIAYYYTIFLLAANMICMFIASQSKDIEANVDQGKWDESQWLSLAFLLGIPIAFPLWFWTTYRALVTGKKKIYYVSMLGISIGILGGIFGIIGIMGYGTCGAFSTIRAKSEKGDTAFFCVLAVLLGWAIQTLFLFFALFKQYRYMRQDEKIALSEQVASMITKAAAKEVFA